MLIIKHLQRGGGYVTPNICYIEENEGLVFKPEIIENNTLQFPVYLVEGDNGQLGIDVYNYLQIKYNPNNIYGTTASISEIIYADNKMCSNIRFRGAAYPENIYLGHVSNGGMLELMPNGFIIYSTGSGGI
jgi:hypothetical protein